MLLGNPIVYWLLKIILLTTLFFCGYGISKDKKKSFHFYATISVIVYSLIQGLRWDRGQDYYHYWLDIETLFSDYICTPNPEPIYSFFVNIWHFLGIPSEFAFVFYSALFIFSFLLVIKHFPKAAFWALPLFYIITESSSENVIRQFFAICFILLAYAAFLNKNKKKMYIFLCCAPLIHFSTVFAVILFLFFTHLRLPKINPLILVFTFIGLYFFWDISNFSHLATFFNSLSVGDSSKMRSYVENADRYLTEEGSISIILGKSRQTLSLLSLVVDFLSSVCVIYFGYSAYRKEPKLQVVYFFSYFAIIIGTISSDIEIISRFRLMLYYMIPLTIGILLSTYDFRNKNVKFFLIAIFSIKYLFYGFIRQIGNMPYHGCAFIWDK